MIITNNYSNLYSNKYPNSQNFTSKNSIITDLDSISRHVRKEFPLYSSTLISREGLKSQRAWTLFKYVSDLITESRGFSSRHKDNVKYLMSILDCLNKTKMGNCSESAILTNLACRLNGYKNSKTFAVYAYNPATKRFRTLDHSVVGLDLKKADDIKIKNVTVYKGDKKSVIIDTWDGTVEYEKNSAIKYRYPKLFSTTIKYNEELCYIPSGVSNNLSSKDLLYIEKKYPKLSMHKSNNIFKALRYFFMDKKKYKVEEFDKLLIESYRRNYKFKKAMSNELYNKLQHQRA